MKMWDPIFPRFHFHYSPICQKGVAFGFELKLKLKLKPKSRKADVIDDEYIKICQSEMVPVSFQPLSYLLSNIKYQVWPCFRFPTSFLLLYILMLVLPFLISNPLIWQFSNNSEIRLRLNQISHFNIAHPPFPNIINNWKHKFIFV